MSQTAENRLRFIEASLLWRGQINRTDLINAFKISESRASADLREYQKRCSDKGFQNLEYNPSRGTYEIREETFQALFPVPNIHHAKALGVEIAHEHLEPLAHTENPKILQKVARAISRKTLLEITYFSTQLGEIDSRPIYPHHLFFDGLSTQIRAFCPKNNGFRTFTLRRILDAQENPAFSQPKEANPERDSEWNHRGTLTLTPHPKCKNPKAVEKEYQMKGGKLVLHPRTCQQLLTRIRLGVLQPTIQDLEEKKA